MDINHLKGAGTALITPFNKKMEIDFPAIEKLVEYQIQNKIDYIVVLGTTGESVTLNKTEKKEIIDFAAGIIKKRVPLIAGFGGNNTYQIVDYLKTFDLTHVDAILSVSPYYNKPNQEGIYRHYAEIANNTDLAVILYNVPGRTGSNLEAETTLRLANDFKNIIAVKEASGDFEQCMKIVKNKAADFLVISGEDIITLPLISIGFNGVISVVSNAYPAYFSQMVHAALSGNFTKARELHYKLINIIKLLFKDSSPGGIKALLNHMDLCENILRMPLSTVSQEVEQMIIKEAANILKA